MKLTDTISVNPGKTTLGHIETPSSIFRSPVLKAEETKKADVLSIILPSLNSGVKDYKSYALPLRTLFATILIVTGITSIISPLSIHNLGFAVCSICFGSFLACGFLTRPMMCAASVFYCISGALLLRMGITDMTEFCLMFGCLIFCVIGAGKYSIDSIIKSQIRRHNKNKVKHDLMDYKAFHKFNY